MSDGELLGVTPEMYWSLRRWMCLERIEVSYDLVETSTRVNIPRKYHFDMDFTPEPLEPGIGGSQWKGSGSYTSSMKGSYTDKQGGTYNFGDSDNGSGEALGGASLSLMPDRLFAWFTAGVLTKGFKGTYTDKYGESKATSAASASPALQVDLTTLDLESLPEHGPWVVSATFDIEDETTKRSFSWRAVAYPAPAIRTIDVWANAFIPGTIDGVTMDRPNHPGETMISGLPFGNCFLTDQRSYSDNPSASTRMHQRLRLDLATNEVTTWKRCDPTVAVHPKTGAKVEQATGDTRRMTMALGKAESGIATGLGDSWVPAKPSTIRVSMTGAANNPLVAATKIAGDVDWEGNWIITVNPELSEATVSFEGLVDEVPSFEAYASTSQGADAVNVFVKPQLEGATAAMNLPGKANRPIKASASLGPQTASWDAVTKARLCSRQDTISTLPGISN